MQVGDLVVYRWWRDDQSLAHTLTEGQKNPQMAIVTNFPASLPQGTVKYVHIHITGIDSALTVPMFKLEVME